MLVPLDLKISVTAFFFVLCIDMCRTRKQLAMPLVALGCAVIASLLFSSAMLVAAMLLFVGLLTAWYALNAWRERRA